MIDPCIAKFEEESIDRIEWIVEHYPITWEMIANCAEQLAIISQYGKYNIYFRLLFDGAHSV